MFRVAPCPQSPLNASGEPVIVRRTPKDTKVLVRPLGPFVGLWTHFDGRRTHPCLERGCRYDDKFPAHWKGYGPAEVSIHVARENKWRWVLCVWELTEEAGKILYPDLGTNRVWEFSRLGKSKNSPVLVVEYADKHQVCKPPQHEAFDVMPILLKLWDIPGVHLNPKPPE